MTVPHRRRARTYPEDPMTRAQPWHRTPDGGLAPGPYPSKESAAREAYDTGSVTGAGPGMMCGRHQEDCYWSDDTVGCAPGIVCVHAVRARAGDDPVAMVTVERDALRAAVDRVRALADEWKQQDPGSHPPFGLRDLRRALDGTEAGDVTAVEVVWS